MKNKNDNEITLTQNIIYTLLKIVIIDNTYTIEETIKKIQNRHHLKNKNKQKTERESIKKILQTIHKELIENDEEIQKEIASQKDINRIFNQLNIDYNK